jgi:hypothetical protein
VRRAIKPSQKKHPLLVPKISSIIDKRCPHFEDIVLEKHQNKLQEGKSLSCCRFDKKHPQPGRAIRFSD